MGERSRVWAKLTSRLQCVWRWRYEKKEKKKVCVYQVVLPLGVSSSSLYWSSSVCIGFEEEFRKGFNPFVCAEGTWALRIFHTHTILFNLASLSKGCRLFACTVSIRTPSINSQLRFTSIWTSLALSLRLDRAAHVIMVKYPLPSCIFYTLCDWWLSEA